MGVNRFFIPHLDPAPDLIHFPGDLARQIRLVLRLKPDDEVIVLDGGGRAFQVRLSVVSESEVVGRVFEIGEVRVQLPADVHLFFPLSKREKVEWILQKATEVGVHTFHPFISERTLVQAPDTSEKRAARWGAIIREAAEQSGRARLPELLLPIAFGLAVQTALDTADLVLAASVSEEQGTIRSALAGLDSHPALPSLALFVGPEGGFSDGEIDSMKTSGVHTVTLGPNVLRMETAAVVFPALVLYELENRSALE